MTTTGKLVVALLLIGAIGGGWYYASDRTTEEPVAENTATETAHENGTTTQQSGKKMAFSEFIKSDSGAYKCTVNQTVQNVSTTGTVYISNKMVRGEFANNYQGKNIDVDFIVRDGYSYTWTSMMPTSGFKVKVNTDTQGNPTGASAGSYSWDVNQVGDYNCESWNADASMFVVPTNITFQTIN